MSELMGPTVRSVCEALDNDPARMMDIVRGVQERLGQVSEEAIDAISHWTGARRIEVASVVDFYSFFSRQKKGKVVIRLCDDIIDRFSGFVPVREAFESELGITLGQKEPQSVGVDRIANAVAAWQITGSASIVIDLGTATKLEAIDASGVFRGGIIAPGLAVSRDALATRAARLFAVELVAPDQAIGRDTISAVQSGLVLGHARMVEGLVGDLAKELGEPDPAILLTGGHAFAIQPILHVNATLYPDLTLYGLRSIFARNRPA